MNAPASGKVDLSIVAPMFNEADNVERTWRLVREGLEGFAGTWEMVLVDDGSTDSSRTVAQGLARDDERLRVLGYDRNRGRGMALRTGFAAARGRIVVSVDFDLSYSIDQVLTLYSHLEEHPDVDVALGSAYMPGGRTEGVPLLRLSVSRMGNRILSRALGGRFHTITCVFRGYRRRVLESLDLESEGKEIHLEILTKCLALGFDVREVPATLRARKRGRSKFRFRGTALSHLLFSFAERPMLLFGLCGGLLALAGTAIAVWALVLSFAGERETTRLWILVVLLFLGGAQALSLGFLAILVGGLRRELYRVQGRLMEVARRQPVEGSPAASPSDDRRAD